MTEEKEPTVQSNQENQVKEPVILGMAANPDKFPIITPQQLFDLMRLQEAFSNLMLQLKQQNLENESLKYYTENDIEIKMEGDKEIKTLKSSFWEKVNKVI